MYDLKFDPVLCESCETVDCLVKCQYMKFDPESARRERQKLNCGEDSPALHNCATCYACEEYCEKGNHPFYHLVELQEKRDVWPAARPIVHQQMKMFAPKGDFQPGGIDGIPMNLCLFPFLKDNIAGRLFENASVLMGRDIFCNLVYLHFAKSSVIKERVPSVIKNLAGCNISELVCFHDECYALYSSWAPAHGIEVPFRPVHLFEYLLDRLRENQSSVKKLGLKVAYQRPCSTRLTPWKEHYLDDLFELIGVERVSREYDRQNALCCGAIFRMQGRDDLADDVNKRNLDDMVSHGAVASVFNCPACYVTMGRMAAERGLMPVLISDLCRLAMGEQINLGR